MSFYIEWGKYEGSPAQYFMSTIEHPKWQLDDLNRWAKYFSIWIFPKGELHRVWFGVSNCELCESILWSTEMDWYEWCAKINRYAHYMTLGQELFKTYLKEKGLPGEPPFFCKYEHGKIIVWDCEIDPCDFVKEIMDLTAIGKHIYA